MKNLLFTFVALGFTVACTPASLGDSSIPEAAENETTTPGERPPSAPQQSPPDAPSPGAPRTTDLHLTVKGDPKNQAVVFIHGGPGANSMMFELTVEEAIAKRGFFVVAYDQRGSTRSPKGSASDYSFAGATKDLDDLIASLNLERPILLGHSFGGVIALHYLDKFPGRAKGAVLAATPINFPAIYDTTLTQCASRYRMWGRFPDAKQADALRAKMFPRGVTAPFSYGDEDIGATIECQQKAMLYFPPLPTKGDLSFMLAHGQDTKIQDVNVAVGSGFHANDRVGHADFTSLLVAHKNEVAAVYAPSWDAMFDRAQLASVQANVRAYFTVADAGHFMFMDQPESFTSTTASALATFQ